MSGSMTQACRRSQRPSIRRCRESIRRRSLSPSTAEAPAQNRTPAASRGPIRRPPRKRPTSAPGSSADDSELLTSVAALLEPRRAIRATSFARLDSRLISGRGLIRAASARRQSPHPRVRRDRVTRDRSAQALASRERSNWPAIRYASHSRILRRANVATVARCIRAGRRSSAAIARLSIDRTGGTRARTGCGGAYRARMKTLPIRSALRSGRTSTEPVRRTSPADGRQYTSGSRPDAIVECGLMSRRSRASVASKCHARRKKKPPHVGGGSLS